MNKYFLICISLALFVSCGSVGTVRKTSSAASLADASQEIQLSETNLARIGRIAPKGRVQDTDYNQLPIVEQLVVHGKASIPFLIGKLDDETKVESRVVDYWSDVRVADVALIILTDLFTDESWESATISGVGWDEFLGGGDDINPTGEQRLRKYVAKHGRKSIKERWQQIWETHKERIFWDDMKRCFRVAAS